MSAANKNCDDLPLMEQPCFRGWQFDRTDTSYKVDGHNVGIWIIVLTGSTLIVVKAFSFSLLHASTLPNCPPKELYMNAVYSGHYSGHWVCKMDSEVHSSELRDMCMSAYTSQINAKCHFCGDTVCNSEDCMVLKRFTVKTNKTRLILIIILGARLVTWAERSRVVPVRRGDFDDRKASNVSVILEQSSDLQRPLWVVPSTANQNFTIFRNSFHCRFPSIKNEAW